VACADRIAWIKRCRRKAGRRSAHPSFAHLPRGGAPGL